MAGVLTQNLVLQKAKVDDLRRVQMLNVCSAQLQDIGVLRFAVNLEVLSLSVNDISELGAISNCRRLNQLYLRRNQIRDINQVLHLTRLPYLEVLNLADNPVSRDPNYRRFVVAAIPSLEKLDDVNISDEEREAAVRVFPELTYFAPPPSRYAQPQEGLAPPPAGASQKKSTVVVHKRPQQQAPPQQQQQQGNRPRSGSYSHSSAAAAPRQQQTPPSRPQHSTNGAGTPMQRGGGSAPVKRSGPPSGYGGPAMGPSETGVVQAVKVLCSELSPEGLDEIRHFIDSMSGY